MLRSKLENDMRTVIKSAKDGMNSTESPDALAECVNRGYIKGVLLEKNAGGTYQFSYLGHIHVTYDGYVFMRDSSYVVIVFKGTIGYVLGIISTLLAQALLNLLNI